MSRKSFLTRVDEVLDPTIRREAERKGMRPTVTPEQNVNTTPASRSNTQGATGDACEGNGNEA